MCNALNPGSAAASMFARGFDLESTHGVRFADHGVGRWVFSKGRGKIEPQPFRFVEYTESAAHAAVKSMAIKIGLWKDLFS
jgi:hypothetical protein